jgi:AraC-like DNA-binding protein
MSVIILMHYYQKKTINYYLLFILLIAGSIRFAYGVQSVGLRIEEPSSLKLLGVISPILPPLYALCLEYFMLKKIHRLKIIIYLSIGGLFIFTRIISNLQSREINLMFFSIFTLYLQIHLLVKSIRFSKQNKSVYNKQQLQKVQYIVIWLSLIILSNLIFTTLLLIFDDIGKIAAFKLMMQWSAVIWMGFCIYLALNPKLLLGEVFQRKDPNRNFKEEFGIWSKKPMKRIDMKDEQIELSLKNNAPFLLEQLINIPNHELIHLTSELFFTNLSTMIHQPKSHIKFIFKYYCRFSISEYLNLIRLSYALELINNGYLEQYTFESLAEKCHFNSRTSFYRNFKKHLGVSPSQYKLLIQ